MWLGVHMLPLDRQQSVERLHLQETLFPSLMGTSFPV